MKYDTQHWFDEQIDETLKYLFQYTCHKAKQKRYENIMQSFQNLDIASTYFLFDLIQERLPRISRLLFAGEDYQEKRETVLDVIEYLSTSK